MVFDVNNEYKEIYPVPFDGDIDKFLEKAIRLRNGVILIEDATSFLSNRGRSDLLTKILVKKRHDNNTIMLLFHSFRQIPKYIFDLSNVVVIFRTNDPEYKLTEFQNDDLLEAWRKVQNDAKGHPFFSSYPPPPGVSPPMTIFKIY